MTAISKPLNSFLEIVKETPLIAIDPFKMIFFKNFLDNEKLITHDLPTIFILLTVAVVSTWPCTKCPDIRSPYLKDFSRLIISPFLDFLKFVLFRVSFEI